MGDHTQNSLKQRKYVNIESIKLYVERICVEDALFLIELQSGFISEQ